MSLETSTGDGHAFISAEGSSSEELSLSQPTGRHPWLIALVTGLVLSLCAGAAVTYFYTPQYAASALLQIEDANPFVVFESSETVDESQHYIQSQIEILRSPVVLEPVLSRPEIASLPELSRSRDRVTYLHDRITINQIGTSELYAVAYKSASPQAAANVVNAVMAEYLNIHSGHESERAQRIIHVLEEERRRGGMEVERLRQRVMDLSVEATGKDPFGHNVTLAADDLDTRAAVLREKLLDIDLDRESLQAENRFLAEQGQVKNDYVDASNDPDAQSVFASEIRALQATNDDNESIIEQIKQSDAKWSENPLYVQLDKSLKGQHTTLDKIKTNMADWPSGERFDRGEKSRENSIYARKLKLAALDAKRQLLSRRLDETVKSQSNRQGKLIELEFTRDELSRANKVFELIANRKLALQTELRAPERVLLRQKASVPTEPDATLPYNRLVIACAAALLAPFAIALAFHRPTRDVKPGDRATSSHTD